jgi:hypothetical protein
MKKPELTIMNNYIYFFYNLTDENHKNPVLSGSTIDGIRKGGNR